MNTFIETQKLNQKWVFFILFGVVGLFVFAVIEQVFFGISFGNKPAPNSILILCALIPLMSILLLYYLRLKTCFDANGIEINFTPLAQKKITWEDVKSMEIIKYDFVGFGLRFTFKYGTVYNTSGNIGLLIWLNNGKKIMIGTQISIL